MFNITLKLDCYIREYLIYELSQQG